ncbi:hypothetical protein FY557_05430 [Chryseobacterium sp. SN22]|uniref:contractile injection system tape measure protein n=1 Tax=Chryseobacterium sp. SN22 TaxID=2606431 RepID=UPI0011EDB98E|nr:contractile injection system tape measure protein [Chryseobacterium sp. SN22]KAA0129340.1 hypothetical protein FY557_05430 [Chryseobacterium sp. SN22]
MNQDPIIQKVFVEITVGNREKAYGIKDDISNFLSIDVFPEIEKYINAIERRFPGQTLQIPKLELDLEVKNSALNAELKNTIIQHFKEELSAIAEPVFSAEQEPQNSTAAHLVGNLEKMVRTFVYFLEHGTMPWWNPGKKGINFLETKTFEAMISSDGFPQAIKPVLSKQKVRNRLIHQLPDVQLAQLCRVLLKDQKTEIIPEPEVIRSVSALAPPDRLMVWQLILHVVSEYTASSSDQFREYLVQQIVKAITAGTSQAEAIQKNLKMIVRVFPFIKGQEIEKEITEVLKTSQPDLKEHTEPSLETILQKEQSLFEKAVSEERIPEEAIPDDGQYVQNAGLILIHPFIKTLFEHCGLLDPETRQLLDPELGAHLLHYIATGKTNAPEYDMVFEKFLCNIPAHRPISRHIKLSRKHKTEAKNVIESVLHNWSPMKNSSAALLQNEFFRRPGKLVVTDYDYTLTVERKTQDILLDKLAWGIGLVKLPWKEKFMYVNW